MNIKMCVCVCVCVCIYIYIYIYIYIERERETQRQRDAFISLLVKKRQVCIIPTNISLYISIQYHPKIRTLLFFKNKDSKNLFPEEHYTKQILLGLIYYQTPQYWNCNQRWNYIKYISILITGQLYIHIFSCRV